MSNRPGPRPAVVNLSTDPRDRYVIPCSCNHEYGAHKRYGGQCKAVDSYGLPCECPSYEADENVLADLSD